MENTFIHFLFFISFQINLKNKLKNSLFLILNIYSTKKY